MPANKNTLLLKDALWYLTGNMAPLIVGFIKSPIYTRHFSPEDYGAYTLVFLLFGYVSVVCYSWIISCGWRYYFRYKQKNQLSLLYSNLSFLYLVFSVGIFIFSAIWCGITGNFLVKKLIILCFLHFFSSEIINLLLIRPRLERRTLYYNLIQAVRAAGSFALLLLFTFVFNQGIESFLTSTIVLNVLILCMIIPNYIRMKPSFRQISRNELIILCKYGQIGLVINICMALLVSSDRFVIEHFTGLAEVGIYNQNYNIAQISIATLINICCATFNPMLLHSLETGMGTEKLKEQFYHFFNLFALLFLPLVVYFIVYVREIAFIMEGEGFREGYKVIYYTAIAEFMAGLLFLPCMKLKFQNATRTISVIYITGVVLNVGLNWVFVPLYGYQSAGITTIAANLFMMIVFHSKDPYRYFGNLICDSLFRKGFLILLAQLLVHGFASYFQPSLYYHITEGIVFFLLYICLIVKDKKFDSIHVQ
jgi:O-antigen/teichoic acid export membrane protein